MKSYLICNALPRSTKSSDPEFKMFRTAIEDTAKGQNADARVMLQRDGNVILEIDNGSVGELITTNLQSLPGVTVSGISAPIEAYVQGRLKKHPATK